MASENALSVAHRAPPERPIPLQRQENKHGGRPGSARRRKSHKMAAAANAHVTATEPVSIVAQGARRRPE